jgi:hypothetical protein
MRGSGGLAAIRCGWHAAQFDNFIVRALHSGAMNLALGAVASASSIWSSAYTAAMANDGDLAILPLPNPTPRKSNNQIIALPPTLAPSGNITFGFNGFPFSTNRIITSPSMNSSSWTNSASVLADGLGFFQYVATPDQPNYFYRAVSP